MDSIKFNLGLVCISKNKCRRLPYSPNKKMHWSEQYKWAEEWKQAVRMAIYEKYKRPKDIEYVLVMVTLYANRPYDQDNSYAACKNLIDGLKGWGIKNDDPAHCEIIVKTIKVKTRKEEHVEIEVLQK